MHAQAVVAGAMLAQQQLASRLGRVDFVKANNTCVKNLPDTTAAYCGNQTQKQEGSHNNRQHIRMRFHKLADQTATKRHTAGAVPSRSLDGQCLSLIERAPIDNPCTPGCILKKRCALATKGVSSIPSAGWKTRLRSLRVCNVTESSLQKGASHASGCLFFEKQFPESACKTRLKRQLYDPGRPPWSSFGKRSRSCQYS